MIFIFSPYINIEPKNAAIVKAIIAMGQALEIPSIAEGVETKEEYDFLKQIGCKELQGFYFSSSISFDQLKEFISSNSLHSQLSLNR